MMNNHYNTANLTTPHGIQMAQHVAAASPPQQTSAAVLNTFYNAQHHQQQQQQLAAAVAAAGGSLYGDPRQLQMSANALDKTYYTTALGTPQRFYTTTAAPGAQVGAGSVASQPHPNTILITNNFTHQQSTQPQSPPDQQRVATLNHPSNIRIVSSSGNSTNLVNTSGAFQHAQHVFNLGNTKTLQQLFPQHLMQQHQQNFHQAPGIITHQFSAQHFPEAQNASATAAPSQISQYYVAAPDAAQLPTTNTKLLGSTVTTASDTSTTTTPLNVGVVNGGGNTNPNASSTVVLDRINICINNLYTDTSSSSASNSLASTPAQLPSPIIPAIQHKAVLDSSALPILSPAADVYESSVLVIDEPDSTTTATTPHTPPTSPENTPASASSNCINTNNNSSITTTTNSISSPSTSSTTMFTSALGQQDTHLSNNITITKQNFAAVAQNIEKAAVKYSDKLPQPSTPAVMNSNTTIPSQTLHSLPTNAPLTPPTPPSPKITGNNKQTAIVDLTDSPSISTDQFPTFNPSPVPVFDNGEDVLIKRLDGRFYLGTVVDKATACNQYIVRFDDRTEQWCAAEEMRKLGGGTSNYTTAAASKSQVQQPMCVSCKQLHPHSKVEICERCGRGYHRHCTKETSCGSKVWLCKRCDKPMKLNMIIKLDLLSDDDSELDVMGPRQLPYDLNSLTWDSKHRVNEEQTYCYCGKSGKFDDNMLQCCRCLNWYHTHCTSKFKGNLLRGDSFFVFSCSVCNDGEEYLRRLQLDWVDLVHLIIYNLSTMKKHQNHKHHHLLKDIYPFALEKRKVLPITQECLHMPDNDFLSKIESTLKENTERFRWGKEIKRDHYFFALRTNGPPVSPTISVKSADVITDNLIVNGLKLKLLPGAQENADVRLPPLIEKDINITPTSKPKPTEDSSSHDIYAFDDTSEDEIPIKLILDKVKNKNRITDELKELTTPSIKSTLVEMDIENDNANDLILTKEPAVQGQLLPPTTSSKSETKTSPKKDAESMKSSSETTSTDENIPLLPKNASSAANIKYSGKASRKRKGFSLTKSSDAQRLFDSSSDENSSSSSRGTSLDLIIPPPKNFLGQNNPFLIVTPKKKTDMPTAASSSCSKKSVSFGIFNTSGLNFSSKLAALKSAGLFPKLSTSNLAKAAGQPRTVRTIKRRLSAKDITIGPNQEVRRRRTRRLSANIEVISTTTINPIPTNFFPIHAKDLLAAAAASTTTAASLFTTPTISSSPAASPSSPPSTTTINSNTSLSPKPEISLNAVNVSVPASVATDSKLLVPTSHGRRLRQRPPKCSPNTSRRSSVSSNQSSTSSSTAATPLQQQQQPPTQNAHQSHEELKQTVNKYFGIVNRIESGEQFSIRAKRQLSNGQMQYLIEWGEQPSPMPQSHTSHKQNQLVESPIKANVEMILESDKGVEEDNVNNVVSG